ncbi:MAG: phosphonate ABC transporter ATP-binding protein [Salibaculum sp.]|jgi:phosphonate transport system ATP-binding protein|uniref:phosphonate ABC transporter ATP-binding protein n=1 Tax=Salibaculum sp. TaxID=2855480 RepID=UPI0028707395|nr:phosphonate ABC transporter ATP-binding protein [Salibaculum sp.]MDR9427648.1 phosphonate ABC transporter ATP-binding protein [Salibaculum sp.]MDR9481610.1 phosphonate ABC transporter ATP-binding protein [Salibaculum sp.]
MTPPDPVLDVRDLHVSYGDLRILRGVTFAVGRGEGVVLLGANGSGKSTLMRAINGLAPASSGRVALDGAQIIGARRPALRMARRRMGYVFQQFNLVPQLSAFQNVLFGVMGQRPLGILNCLNAVARAEDREHALSCLERVGLADRAGHRPTELSGGQQQRVAIARMLMQRPSMVVADEPIASLDPKAGREVLDLLWRIVDDEGLSMLCSLHQLDLAREYADRVIGLKAGKVQVNAATGSIDPAGLDGLYDGATRPEDATETKIAAV